MKEKTKELILPMLILAILLSLTILTGTMLADKLTKNVLANYSNKDIEVAQSIQAPEEQEPQKKYILKANNGRIAVYVQDETNPFMELETVISALPDYDKQLLQKGITVTGEEELRRIIEDYSG